jgi:hypothetical protein
MSKLVRSTKHNGPKTFLWEVRGYIYSTDTSHNHSGIACQALRGQAWSIRRNHEGIFRIKAKFIKFKDFFQKSGKLRPMVSVLEAKKQ